MTCMKICLVCASGGHLTEMLKLEDAFTSHDIFLVTYKEEFLNLLKNLKKVYFIKNILVNRVQANRVEKAFLIILQMLLLTVKEFKILLIENPDVVISTGSEIAIPICYMAKIFGKKVIFIESLCRINNLSGTGKIVSAISDLFLVQWERLAKKCKKAEYKGNVLTINFNSNQNDKLNEGSFILVTVGTASLPRLVEEMDDIAGKIDKKVIMQIGKTNYKPKNAEYFDFKPYPEMQELNQKARVVVSHAGVGSIITVLEQATPVIVVPRLKKYKEANDNHQLEIANVMAEEGKIIAVYDVNELEDALERLDTTQMNVKRDTKLIKELEEYINNIK